ncbi:MAG: PSD1 and planctomycete cytochrome C domain-containing protein [Verrucomicrobiaceae bacterium]
MGIFRGVVGLGFLAASASAEVRFNRDIRPIMADKCFNCHGADEGSREAKLRLDVPEEALADRGGVPAIVPGDLKKSEMIFRIFNDDEDEVMPPPDHPHQLSDEEKETLKQWILEGAKYEGHWAFAPVGEPEVSGDSSWARNGIDGFVLRAMEENGLSPQVEASRETLIRRLSLDLTGLPPTAEEVSAFVEDTSPDAYDKLVDRILASPHYGERMAMWWLDGARYADTHGFQADWERYQWPWRDWVIRAFNSNMPFDQFTIEQLAGDLLPEATNSQIVATGFNRNHRINTEGGALNEEWLIENVIDRVETTGSVWMGLTFNCCRCHDHKYDPISQKEFYQFFAFFNNVPEEGKGPGKAGNFDPVVRVDDPEHDSLIARLSGELKRAKEEDEVNEQPVTSWQIVEDMTVQSAGGTVFEAQPDHSYRAAGPNPVRDTRTFSFRGDGKRLTAFRIEALPDASFANEGFARKGNGNFVVTQLSAEMVEGEERRPLQLVRPVASYEQKGFAIGNVLDGKATTGWAVDGNSKQEPREALFEFEKPVTVRRGQSIEVTLKSEQHTHHHVDRLRFSLTSDESPSIDGKRISPVVARLEGELKAAKARHPTVMVMKEMAEPRPAHLLERGEYDKPGELVTAATPAFLPALGVENPNRLDLARWLVRPDHPLTSRVQVNRLWENLFGVGLVETSENFGVQADYPSHPELLDFLAKRYAENWDTKALLKLMVSSATYRQRSHTDSLRQEKDPFNRLLSRGPRFRLQAEMIRDQALAVSGLLNAKIGGPSVRPYQPEGIWSETNFYGNLRDYKHDTNGGQYRRSIYTIWKRTAAPPGMTLFDMPSREICTVKRPRTNTPLQALALQNDPTYLEAARVLAEKAMSGGGAPAAWIARAFHLATARSISAEELQVLEAGYLRRLSHFELSPEDTEDFLSPGEAVVKEPSAQLAALTTTTSLILNLDEVITKE